MIFGARLSRRLLVLAAASYVIALLVLPLTREAGVAPWSSYWLSLGAGLLTYLGCRQLIPALRHDRVRERSENEGEVRLAIGVIFGVLALLLLLTLGFAAASTLVILVVLPIGLAANVFLDSKAATGPGRAER